MSDALVAAIRAPIDPGMPEGAPLDDDDPDFAALDTELMKRGGLSQGSIDWGRVEALSRSILMEKSKHMAALSGLCGALGRRGDCAAAARVATAFVETYWEIAHPAGKRMARRRAAMAEEIAHSLARATQPHVRDDADARARLAAVLETMRESWRGRSLPVKALDEAVERLGIGPEAAVPAPAASGGATASAPSPAAAASPPAAADTDPLAAMDTREIKRYREEIKGFADRIGALDPEAAMPYLLRRYGAWLRQNQAPIADGSGRTTIQPMPGFVAGEFMAALAQPDRGVLSRLEDRLSSDPYWFEGHRLAAQLAAACGLGAAARAIRSAVAERVARFPELDDLLLTDGTPMIDDEVRGWLAGAGEGGDGGDEAPWTAALAEARREIDAGANFAAALDLLEQGLDGAAGERDRAHWRLAFADLLSEMGLERLAREMYAALLRDVDVPALQAWEPALLRTLRARAGDRPA